MKKKVVSFILAAAMGAALLTGCGENKADGDKTDGNKTASAPQENKQDGSAPAENGDAQQLGETNVTVFAAKSLGTVLDELIKLYNEKQPNVTITPSYDSSGTLMEQIENGAACDVFFSAAQKQMDQLQDQDKMIVEGTRHNVVNNQVCVVTYKGSNTKVTGLKDIKNASSFALADGSVPVGKYTRQAMVNAGMLEKADDVSAISTETVSKALGGIEINECANVGAVTSAVSEGSNEVGTVYYSDTYGLEDKLQILEKVSYDLTGDVIYPVAQVTNEESDALERQAAVDFINFLISDDAKTVFQKYYFDTNVTD